MNDFISEEEFSPLSYSDVDFLIQLSLELAEISESPNITHSQRSLIEVGKTHILRLTAMTCAGYELYVLNNKFAKAYKQELERVTEVAIQYGAPEELVRSAELKNTLQSLTLEFSSDGDVQEVVIETFKSE